MTDFLTGIIAILALTWTVTGCVRLDEDARQRAGQPSFFDLSEYFDSEIERLRQSQPRATKRIILGEEEQEQQWDSLDYGQELKPFVDSDINRPAWYDKYRTDTLRHLENQTSTLQYTALDDKLRVRKLEVTRRNADQQVIEIRVVKETDSLVEELRQELSYRPGEGYTVTSLQEAYVGAGHKAVVAVRWEEKK